MMERVALSAGRCGSECVEYSLTEMDYNEAKGRYIYDTFLYY